MEKNAVLCSVAALLMLVWLPFALAGHDYSDALSKSILFYQAQRSGRLGNDQKIQWRSNSALYDGKAQGVDLVGGYYDAGDNVKFGLPMAFTITMLSWSIIEYRDQLYKTGELENAIAAVKWGTDYFIKAHTEANVLYGEVGDGDTDHYCWQRPEDMTTSRQAYKIDAENPGSDLAGETAAAMAAASIVFHPTDSAYSNTLLRHAKELFVFADTYRGKYDSSIRAAQKYYRSVSGYNDELLWAAAWLYKATGDQGYLAYLANNAQKLGGSGWSVREFSWDVKYAGVQTLVSKILKEEGGGGYEQALLGYKERAEEFMCSNLGLGEQNVQKTPGGLIYRQKWNNMQFVTGASFLLAVYADHLGRDTLQCDAEKNVPASRLLSFAKSQVDYILGDNPRATSYMAGYGLTSPQQIHHRASSMVSVKTDATFIACRAGYAEWYTRNNPNPNELTGALVGGPDAYDNFADERDNYMQTEPATYNNAPFIGLLARFAAGPHSFSQQLPVASPLPKSKPAQSAPVRARKLPVAIWQKMLASWRAKGRTYYKYSVTVVNESNRPLTHLKLHISKLYGPIWGLMCSGSSCRFTGLDSLPRRGRLVFVYIHAATNPAVVSVTNYTLG